MTATAHKKTIEEAWSRRRFDRMKMAHDASHYYLLPEAVATPSTVDEVVDVFRVANRRRHPITFRSGGTSLSGQGVTDGILVDTRRHFREVEIMDGGQRVRVQPGVTVRRVNAHLVRHGYQLGPDPASEIACTLGGVIANNSSGMKCGTEFNTYNTLESMTVVLPSGTVIDTGAPDADAALQRQEPELHAGLLRLRQRVIDDPEALAEVQRLFAMKNTMGYGINSLVDFARPVDILQHLMVGSEGTLGFVAEAVFRTIPIQPAAATGLAIFENLADATEALPGLVSAGFTTIELLDATSLQVAQRLKNVPQVISDIDVDTHAALLIELSESDTEQLRLAREAAQPVLDGLPVINDVDLTTEPAIRNSLWHIRKGLYAAVAEARPSGTVALLEDVVVPVAALRDVCEQLIGLFNAHGYEDAVIFGHAKDGNIHFMLTENWDESGSLQRYEQFTEEMVSLILNHGGALKAEHGTGRIMAPFVRRQYGDELYGVMEEIKALFDPHHLLNPGVVLTNNPHAHLENLKDSPEVEEEVDRCVECGYCEPVCPSQDLTTTPRQRIVIRREMRKAELAGDHELLAELRRDYDYEGTQTCAVDGMCQVACPVNINTGDLTRRLREENLAATTNMGWSAAAHQWSAATRAGSAALSFADNLPEALPKTVTRLGRAVLGKDNVPLYDGELPKGGERRRPQAVSGAQAVFFPSCIGALFGPENDAMGATRALLALCEKAEIALEVPEEINSLCCGTPWKSKGVTRGFNTMRDKVLPALWKASDEGRLPIICDAASCTEGLAAMAEVQDAAETDSKYSALQFVDAVAFVTQHVMPHLQVRNQYGSIALHPTCSSTHLEINDDLENLARAIATTVHVPVNWQCCAFAGDRGLLHPELTASATAAESQEIRGEKYDAYASLNHTCEIAMTRATGEHYQHILELVEYATR